MFDIKIKKKSLQTKFIIAIILVLLYYSFFYIYKIEIHPAYYYYGFGYHPLSFEEYAITLFFLLAPLIFLPVTMERPSSFAIWSLYLFSYTSTCYVLFYVEELTFFRKLLLITLLLISLYLTHIARFHKINISFKRKINWLKLDILTIFIIIGITIFILLYLINFQLKIPSREQLYTIRLTAREIKKIPFQGYIIALANSVLTLIGIYLFVYKRKILYLLLVLLTNLAIFNFQGTKTSIAKPIFFIFFALIIKKIKSKKITWLICFLLICVFISLVEIITIHSSFLSEVIVRRIFAVPGLLNIYHFDFFSHNPKVLLTDSRLNFFMKPVYPLPYTHMIGLEYFNLPERNADTGIWMAGFAHFGYLGVIIISLLAGFLLGILDNLLRKDFYYFGCLISIYIGTVWAEQGFHTSFLTGGVFYIFLMVFIILKSFHLSKEFSASPTVLRNRA